MTLLEININSTNNFINFISPIIGVILSAIIAWCVYNKQKIEKEVKSNVITFSYLLSSIFKNFEELSNIKEQITVPALEEINNYIETIDEIEKYIDWAVGNAESPLKIQIVDKMGYAQKKVQELSSKLVLSVATIQHFNYIDTTKFIKEASLLPYFGDLNFISICNRLDTQYNVLSDIKNTILQYNEENIKRPRSMYYNFKIISDDNNYKENLSDVRGQILYRKSLFDSYDKTVTRCLVISYNAALHLEGFFYHYLKKYCVVVNRLGIPFKTFELKDETFFEQEKFQNYLENILPQEYQLFAIPLYTHLKRTFLDKISDFIFYGKWK